MENRAILKQVYERNLNSMEEVAEQNQKYLKLNDKIMNERAEFRKLISSNSSLIKQFDEIEEKQHILDDIYSYECFAYGFKLGTGLMSETLSDFYNVIIRDKEKYRE